MVTIGVYGLTYLATGSLGIAIYRLLYIKFQHVLKGCIGEKIFLWVVLFLNVTFNGLVTFLFMIEESSHRVGINMCTGLSVKQTQVLIDYNSSRGLPMITSTVYQTTTAATCLAAQIIEFTIYVWFFCYRYKHDNGSIAKLLTQETVRERNIKNVTTLVGQMYGFLVECVFMVAAIVIIQLGSEFLHHVWAIGVFMKFVSFGVLSAVDVFTSPGLRKSMK